MHHTPHLTHRRSITRIVTIDSQRCKGCELCVAACPCDVLQLSTMLNDRSYRHVEIIDDGASRCSGCGSCGVVCPDGCITIYRTTDL